MANILRTIIENDKGELRKLEKMANKVIAYSDQMAALSDEELKAKTDYVYRDDKGILAWLDIRDSDLYKFDDDTKDAIFIIQGNANTSVEMRLEALKRIQSDLKECMPDMKFEALVIKQAED